MSAQGRELALTIINTGKGYAERCLAAREKSQGMRTLAFAGIATRGARTYEREFPGAKFSCADELYCAAELADYYERHVAETDAAKRMP